MLFFVQAEDGIRDLVRSRGLGDVYKRQDQFVLLHVRHRDHDLPVAGRGDLGLADAEAVDALSLIHI